MLDLPDTGRPLRAWQQEAMESYVENGEPEDYLVTATPGAGKTTFALTFARWLLERRLVNRVVVVVPTDHLRTQWAEAANDLGVFLDPSLDNNVAQLSTDYHGYVATYAQVSLNSMMHRSRVERTTTLVILDEVHHAGEGLTWGDAVYEAFSPAVKRLSLTGTPFRTSATETIPFVRYVRDSDGSMLSQADYTYGYKEALADNVVRPVMFAAYSGVSRWRNSAGEVMTASLSEDGRKEDEMAAWRTALNPAGQWIPHVVAAADQRLTEIRDAGMPDAGGLMLASDQEHARAYAKIIEKVTGHSPVVVLSDDPKASSKIDAFSAGTERWMVAVRMVSEGVDVPRLACGVWSTSYRTPLFFAQAIGRFVRSRRPGETATVFLPAVKPLLALAASMEEERSHVIPPPATQDDLDFDSYQPELPEPASNLLTYEALEADAEFAHVLFGGKAITGDSVQMNLTAEDEDYLGLPGLLEPAQMAVLLKQRESEHRKTVVSVADPDSSPMKVQATHKQVQEVRREINKLVSRRAARASEPHAKVHAMLRKQVPGPPSASAPLEVLMQRRDHLLSLLT